MEQYPKNHNHEKHSQTSSLKNEGKMQNNKSAIVVQKRKKKNGAVIVTVCFIALFAVLAAAVMALLFYKPHFDDDDHPLQSGDITNVIFTDDVGNTVDRIERDQNRVNFLLVGRDRWAFNTDVMILLSYNVKDGAISMMQIPRDTYFDVGQKHCKANAILAQYYNRALKNGQTKNEAYKTAIADMEKAIEDTFGIIIDYHAIIDLNGFVKIIDAIGGVEIDVPARMNYSDPVQGLYIDLKPGPQTLTGAQAEQFIRFRSGYVEGDIGRVDAQKLFISACVAQIKNNFNASTISAVLEQIFKYVTTNIPLQDLVYYAKSALSVDLSKMTMMTLPGIQCRQYNESGIWYYVAYREATIAALNKYFNLYNYDITSDIFDRSDALYDEDGTYMHSICLTKNVEEESYTADGTDDIHIYRYSPSSSKPSTTAESSADEPLIDISDLPEYSEEIDVTGEIDEAGNTDETANSEESDVTEPSETDFSETTSVTDEPTETSVVEVPEVPVEPEKPAGSDEKN